MPAYPNPVEPGPHRLTFDTRRRLGRFLKPGARFVLAFILASGMCSCQTAAPAPVSPESFRVASADGPSLPRAATDPARTTPPAAAVNGRPISWDTINPAFRELAGNVVLTDAVLDVMLKAELERSGILLDADYARRETSRLVTSIAGAAGIAEERAEQLLTDLRTARGLGPTRFRALLRRNAMLRALARSRIEQSGSLITDEDVRRRFDVVYGPRLVARIITVPTQRQAVAVRAMVLDGDGAISDRFSRVAVAHSTDGTGPRGGLLDPISPADPAYELNVRRVMAALEPGELSQIIALEQGFAILLLEERLPAQSTDFETVKGALREELDARQERLIMDRFARELLDEADVTIDDPSLKWAWDNR
ncbi:MAG: peptidylprolyl isomerase [Planctomycetes bacterium]|nr:peptidylprolyl isomerase [Planctomycetota bacterium]